MAITFGNLTIWSSCCVWLASTSSLAQQTPEPPSLEQLLQQPARTLPADVEVSTANRQQQTSSASSQVTYMVTDDEIHRLNLRTLGEILSLLPGLYVSSDSTYGYLTARGIGRPGDYNSRLLFLVDGTRVNDNIYDTGLIGSNFYLDTQLIERVEFTPGTGSALYGNNAYLGVVNIISKKAHKLQDVQLFGSVSNQNQQDWLLSYGLRDPDGHEGYLAVSHNHRRQIPIPELEATDVIQQAVRSNTDENTKFAGAYSFRRFSISFAKVNRDRHLPWQVDDIAQDSHTENDIAFVAARYSQRLSDSLEWFGHLSSNQTHIRTITPFDDSGLDLVFDVDGNWTNFDQRFSYQHSAQQQWLFGFDVQSDHHQAYSLSFNEVIPISKVASNNLRMGLFSQLNWQFHPKHNLVMGVRYDATRDGLRQFSPKLGWAWQPNAIDQWRVNLGRAFRAPNEYEMETNRFFDISLPESEQIDTAELNWQRQWSGGWHSSVSVYRNKLRNLITASFGIIDVVPFYNDQPITAHGVELALQQTWLDQSQLDLSLSVQQAHNSDQQPLSNSPDKMLKIQYDRPLVGDSVFISYRLFAASKRLSAQTQLAPKELAGFANHDLSLRWQWQPSASMQFTVKNLTDHLHTDAPLPTALELKQPGRSIELSLQWTLP